MKKAVIFFILMSFVSSPVQALIADDFARSTLDSSLEIKAYAQKAPVDEFVQASLNREMKIKKYDKQKHELSDDFVKNRTCALPAVYKVHYMKDNFLPNDIKITKKAVHITDFSKTETPVQIKIRNILSTKTMPDEGCFVEFETVSDVKINNRVYPKGSTVKGRIETVSGNGFCGVPADLVVGNFSLNGVPLQGELQKSGKNHSVWVRSLATGGSFFFGAGLLFLLVRGGQARIIPEETYTVFVRSEL